MIRRLVIGTANRHKLREIKEILAGLPFEVVGITELGFPGEIDEDRPTIEENARKKAHELARRCGALTAADDTGLEVDALGGRPGVLSSRYSGPGATYESNNRKLLAELDGLPAESRRAVFRCVIALADPEGVIATVEGATTGRIVTEPRGTGGFGYDPVFQPDGFELTYAEMGAELKNRLSHRGKAVRALQAFLERAVSGADPTLAERLRGGKE